MRYLLAILILFSLLLIGSAALGTDASSSWFPLHSQRGVPESGVASSAEQINRPPHAAPPNPIDNVGRVPEGDPEPVPILYRFFDFGNDWQQIAPEWGPVGSIQWTTWEEINPEEGVYNWSIIDAGLASERGLSVTLPDGQVIPKPVVIQIFPYISSAYDWHDVYFYDATPEWVYDVIDEENPDDPRPIVNDRKVGYRLDGCGTAAVLPMYDSEIWRTAYFDAVRAMAERYRDDPQVTAVVINTGLDGETQLIKDWGCGWNSIIDTQYTGGLRYRFGQFLYQAMDVYRQAFPNEPIFINNAPGGGGTRKATSDYAASLVPPVGLKHSGMWVDSDGHEGYGAFVGMFDMINAYSMTVPIWLESKMGYGSSEVKYWSLLAGLHYHPDAIDLHPDYFSMVDPEILRWVGTHIGKTLDDTPSVWTALRDYEFPLVEWTTGASSGHMGDWNYWLKRKELPGGGTVRIWREGHTPAPATTLAGTNVSDGLGWVERHS